MPSRYVSSNRSKQSAPSMSEQAKSEFTDATLESLLGVDDSILETVENELRNNMKSGMQMKKYPVSKANTITDLAMDIDNFSQTGFCDVSQLMNYDLKRTFDYAEFVKEERDPILNNLMNEESQWHDETVLKEDENSSLNDVINEETQWNDQTIFNQALTGQSLDDSTDVFDTSILTFKHSQKLNKEDDDESESLEKAERQSSTTSDEFVFGDLSLNLEEQDEFSLIQKEEQSRNNSNTEVEQAMCNNKEPIESNPSASFYGMPEKIKTLIHKTKNISSLYNWQEECLNLKAVKDRKNLIYALPTSGGKTLVAEILMLKEILCNKKNVIFVLPFVAIVQEKVQALTQFALELGFLVEEYAGGKGQYPPVKRSRKNSIYICTIEKAQGLVNSLIELKRLNEIGIVVVDELHLLGENGGRGATLEGLLTKIMYAGENVHIVGMSATIGNLKEVADFLKADVYTKNFRPVEIKEYVKCGNQIWLLNMQEDPIFTDEKKINYRYSETAGQLDPDRIGGLVMDVVPKDSCLVFCSSRKNCENVALLLTRVLFRSVMEHKANEKDELLVALRAEGELCPILVQTIKFGVAYHHSGLTSEERRLLEDAFREGVLCVICCTSTLAAGVNLPARRVILRSPYVGNQFLNLSRYKQMIGRAGRAGLGEIGESILICKGIEIPKVQELLTSRMDDCLSTLHLEEDRGINNLILSSVMLSIATTRTDMHKLIGSTLLGVQQDRMKVSVKTITDRAISSLLKAGVLRIKRSGDFDPNVTVDIQSQLKGEPKSKKGKRTIILSTNTVLELSPLGRAAMKGSIDLQCAYTLYQDLKAAQENLVLVNDLHIMYLVTPYDLASQLKPIGSVLYNVITNMPASHMQTPRVLGINEMTVAKLRDGAVPKNIAPRVINRFWLTLILYDLWQHRPLYVVAEKYQVNRGVIQNLLTVASTFANSVVRFCQELQEFWAFTDLLTTFSKKLRYCCAADLEPLMELPAVKVVRARQLFNAGYKTLQSIATAKPEELETKVKHLPRRTIMQMIAAANLLLMEKVENLRDEAAQVLEGLDMSHFA